jgi:predicted NUDIX family phosphoesterase
MNKNELIAVATKENIFKNIGYQNGFIEYNANIIKNIIAYHSQSPRHLAELDYSHKQIVSYIIFMHNENLFLMERSKKSSEQKLKNKFSLGIGGHLNTTDLQKDILYWGMREFEEEVHYTNTFKITPIGIINDDSNDVGKLHLGIVYIMAGTSDKISIKSELKSGQLISINNCLNHYDKLEPWSQLVINFITQSN